MAEYPSNGAKSNKNLPLIIAAVSACGCLFVFIPIVAAVLFPVFAQAREQARSQVCLSNAKQISLGLIMYVQDYDQVLPPADVWEDGTQVYVRNTEVFHCPNVPRESPTTMVHSYAYYSKLEKKNVGYAVSPAATIMMYDSTLLSKNGADELTSLPSPGRHMKVNIFGFLDGHCQAMGDIQTATVKKAMDSKKLFVVPKK